MLLELLDAEVVDNLTYKGQLELLRKMELQLIGHNEQGVGNRSGYIVMLCLNQYLCSCNLLLLAALAGADCYSRRPLNSSIVHFLVLLWMTMRMSVSLRIGMYRLDQP